MRRRLHRHDLSMEHDFSANMGKLIPSYWKLVYPGDVVRQRSTFFVRVSPMIAPIYNKVLIKAETYYVAADNVWDDAQKFFSKGQDGTDATTVPKIRLGLNGRGAVSEGDLVDHLGIAPTGAITDLYVNALIPRVFNSIYNWRYRNFDLQSERVISKASGVDTTTDISLPNRNWEKDRFTTARLEPQRGDDVLIPGGPGVVDDLSITRTSNALSWKTYQTGTDTPGGSQSPLGSSAGSNLQGSTGLSLDPIGGLEIVDDSVTLNLGTIRELGERVAINRFRTRLQTSDGSYPDYTLATFGVRAPDIELQRPVLLARSTSALKISEVLQTSQAYDTSDDPVGSPVGEYAGHGIEVHADHAYKYKVKRHGYIMTVFSVVPEAVYDYALEREWLRVSQEDYFDPDLDQIGEDVILEPEISLSGNSENSSSSWDGYQFRNYCDRSTLNRVSGEFHTTLDYFGQWRKFLTPPALNSDFVTCDPSDRIFALGSTQDQLRVKALHDVKALRTMRATPTDTIL